MQKNSQNIFISYAITILIVGLCTLINFSIYQYVDHSNLIMLYLLGVVIVAILSGENRGPAIVAALTSTLLFDFYFIRPYFSFKIEEIQYVFTLIVMLLVAHLISQLTISIRRHTEVAKQAQIQAETEHLRNTLLTSISHDFRTPLTAIMGSASSILLPGEMTTDMQHELVQNIYDESERLNRLVTNILQTIRLEAGSMRMNIHVHDLYETIHTVLHKLKRRLTNREINIHIPDQLPYVPFDNILLEQVLVNLIENADKFAPMDSPIEINIMNQDKQILVKVIDHGPGVNVEDKEQIFAKFYRGHKPESSGVGLGLAICKGIIQAHGGEIWVESDGIKGATFNFTLPLDQTSHVE